MTTPTPHRISSTQIQTFLDCPRKWALAHLAREEGGAGKAAAIGSIFHAIQELRLRADDATYFPDIEATRKAGGNYQTTEQLFAQFGDDALWPTAKHMAEEVGHPDRYLPDADLFPVLFVEYDLDPHALPLLGGQFTAGGYLDLLLLDDAEAPTQAWIGDWKTRGASSFKTRPRSEDFEGNVQLAYYAAAVSRAWPTIETVTVRHINVLRPEKSTQDVEVSVDGWAYSRARLDREWAWLEEELCPQMAEARAEFERGQMQNVLTDTRSCFKFGRCPHQKSCQRADVEAQIAASVGPDGRHNPFFGV